MSVLVTYSAGPGKEEGRGERLGPCKSPPGLNLPRREFHTLSLG